MTDTKNEKPQAPSSQQGAENNTGGQSTPQTAHGISQADNVPTMEITIMTNSVDSSPKSNILLENAVRKSK